MKIAFKLMILLFAFFPPNIALATEEITGTWQGELIPAPGAEITVQFIISRATNGAYGVVLNSPEEGGIKNIAANKVTYDGGKLKLDVEELSGSYEGIVKNGAIEGKWMQEGTTIPLDLSPYEKPVLSSEEQKMLLGEWHGDMEVVVGMITIVLRFEMTENGDLAGYLDMPDENASGIPITDIEGVDGNVTLKVSSRRAEITGKLTENEIIGKFKGGPDSFPLTLKKGKYTPPTDEFKLSEEDREIPSSE